MYHLRAMLTASMGFSTDAYDLFIIGVALALIKLWGAQTSAIAKTFQH
jgi:MFS transporter, PHS family, inorganic phosphate transporter